MKWFKENFPDPMPDELPETLRRYRAAYIMELIGAVLLPDSSGDAMPAMYVQFLQDLDHPKRYSWGSAVLACLYRNLCHAAYGNATSISGPLMLLQMWIWTRFPLGRPKAINSNVSDFGEENIFTRCAYGYAWCGKLRYPNNTKGKLNFFRNQIDQLHDEDILWSPYDEYLGSDLAPATVIAGQDYWFARIEMVHFWTVEAHYPDRVMRQLGRYQMVPPPQPNSWTHVVQNHELDHTTHDRRHRTNWATKLETEVTRWNLQLSESLLEETRPYDERSLRAYLSWYVENGMTTITVRNRIIAGLKEGFSRPPKDEIGMMPLPPRHELVPRMVERMLSMAALGMKMILTSHKGIKENRQIYSEVLPSRIEEFRAGSSHR